MKAVLAPEPDPVLIEKLKAEYKALLDEPEEEEEYSLIYQMFFRFFKPTITINNLTIKQEGKPNVPPYGGG